VTGQRRLLLELIQAGEGHLDAQELFRQARERDPRLSLSTVYRTLDLLRDMGLVNELHLGEEHHHYEMKPVREHHHLICQACGQVEEFHSSLIDRLRLAVARDHGFEVMQAQVDLTGYCARCRKERKPDEG
jgi:Fe2+ or Zn2+ uptake regulation protein